MRSLDSAPKLIRKEVKKERKTLKNTVAYDPLTKTFIQKDHVVKKRILIYPMDKCANPSCGKDYPKKRKDQRFCSMKCRYEFFFGKTFSESNPEDRNCVICGGVFTPTRQWSKYCGPECQEESRVRKQREKRQAVLA